MTFSSRRHSNDSRHLSLGKKKIFIGTDLRAIHFPYHPDSLEKIPIREVSGLVSKPGTTMR